MVPRQAHHREIKGVEGEVAAALGGGIRVAGLGSSIFITSGSSSN